MEVAAYPDPLSLLADSNPKIAANKRLVFDMWRSIVNAGHVELADEMLREDYIQHSPVIPTGRAAFKAIFSAVPRTDIPAVVSPPLVTILGEGNLVVMALREEMPQPNGKGRYSTTHFNLFRVDDGRLAEHWHSVQEAPNANVLPPEKGGPQRVTGATGAARQGLLQASDATLAANKRLVFEAWQGSDPAASPIDPSYIEHDPNGGAVSVQGEPRRPDFPPRAAPLVAMVAERDLVVLVTALEHPNPVVSGETYTTTWFDMFRVVDGRLVEHWNGAIKPGTPLPTYGK